MVVGDCECCFFSANLSEDVQLAATLTPDGPVHLIIDFVTPKINLFLPHLLSLSLPPFRANHPAYSPQAAVCLGVASSRSVSRVSVNVCNSYRKQVATHQKMRQPKDFKESFLRRLFKANGCCLQTCSTTRGPDSSGTGEGHASGSAYQSSPLWSWKQDAIPGKTRRPFTIGMQRQRRLESCCFSDDQTLSLVILPRSRFRISARIFVGRRISLQSNPKRLHQAAEILNQWRAQRFGILQLGASVEESGKTGSASNPPSDPRVDSNDDGIQGFGSG